jgi:hypothetical protein
MTIVLQTSQDESGKDSPTPKKGVSRIFSIVLSEQSSPRQEIKPFPAPAVSGEARRLSPPIYFSEPILLADLHRLSLNRINLDPRAHGGRQGNPFDIRAF